jgi:hypothetical protein
METTTSLTLNPLLTLFTIILIVAVVFWLVSFGICFLAKASMFRKLPHEEEGKE